MTELVILKKRAEVFLKNNISVHLVLKDDTWLNGYILKIYDDYFDFYDRKDKKVPVFFADIRLIEFFKGNDDTLKKPEGDGDGQSNQ